MTKPEANLRAARARWGRLSPTARRALREINILHGISIAVGEVLLLNDAWYVTHTGLLRIAARNRCAGIDVQAVTKLSDPAAHRWAFKATVYKTRSARGFVGYGDADPTNVSPQVRGAELRIAETRAVNRALRKAYGVGICSVEELGAFSVSLSGGAETKKAAGRTITAPSTSNGNGPHPVRDRLCLAIRQHRLDPGQVKAYAADYCGVKELRAARREQVEEFIAHLSNYAQQNREGLLCQLNSYAPTALPPEPTAKIAPASSGGDVEKGAGAA